ARSVAAHKRAALEEVQNPETGGETRAARRRQDMVGTGDIVADRLGGMPAEEDRTGMMNPLGQLISLVDRQFEMLRCDPVGQRRRLFPIADEDNRAVRTPARPRDLRPWQLHQIVLDRYLDRGREGGIIGDEDRLCSVVVL